MIIHMIRRTTLMLEEQVLRDLKRVAAEEGRTLSDVTLEVVQRGLRDRKNPRRSMVIRLPVFSMGRARVDIADRDRLYDLLDAR